MWELRHLWWLLRLLAVAAGILLVWIHVGLLSVAVGVVLLLRAGVVVYAVGLVLRLRGRRLAVVGEVLLGGR